MKLDREVIHSMIEKAGYQCGKNTAMVDGEKSFWLALDHRRGVGNRCCGQRGNFFEPIDPANIHRLCGSPSIPLSFNLAAVLPRRLTSRVSYVTKEMNPQQLVDIV